MATRLQRALLLTLAVLLLALGLSLRSADRADAKGLGVEPRVGSPGTLVTLQTLFPGAPPDHDVTLSLVPQGAPGTDCSTVLAVVTPRVAEGVTPEAWELSGTLTIPDALTCGGEERPIEPGMYWIEIGGAEIDIPPNSDVDLSRAQFGVPDFSAGTLGAGFSSYVVVLNASTVSALEKGFPGRLIAEDEIDHQQGQPLILTLTCPAGCYEDPIAGQPTGVLQAFYYPYLDVEGGLIAFDPYGPFYSLGRETAQALNLHVGLTPERRLEELARQRETPVESRRWAPYVIAAVVGGLGFALAAFGAGVVLGRRTRRPALR